MLVVYTPQHAGQNIAELIGNLERFINDGELSDYDDVVKMTLIRHQFESMYPSCDGNGTKCTDFKYFVS